MCVCARTPRAEHCQLGIFGWPVGSTDEAIRAHAAALTLPFKGFQNIIIAADIVGGAYIILRFAAVELEAATAVASSRIHLPFRGAVLRLQPWTEAIGERMLHSDSESSKATSHGPTSAKAIWPVDGTTDAEQGKLHAVQVIFSSGLALLDSASLFAGL